MKVAEVSIDQHIPDQRPLSVAFHEVVDGGGKSRAVLAERPCEFTSRMHDKIVTHDHVRKYCRPVTRLVAVDNRCAYQAAVHHLQNVFCSQELICLDDVYRLLASIHKGCVQERQVLVVTRRPANVDGLARKIVERSHPRACPGREDDNFVNTGGKWNREVDDSRARVRDREVSGDEISLASEQCRDQVISADRHRHDLDLVQAAAKRRVQLLLEQGQQFGYHPSRLPFVVEELRTAGHHEHPDESAFDHPVEISAPGHHQELERLRQ